MGEHQRWDDEISLTLVELVEDISLLADSSRLTFPVKYATSIVATSAASRQRPVHISLRAGLEASVLHLEKLPGLMLRDYAASCSQGIRKKR